MNWANRLTLGRLALTILFVLAMSSNWTYGRTAALVLFLLASITDYLDGEIARRWGIITKFGKLMDPLVDKMMMAAAFICLVPIGAVPAWVATIVVARDFLITGLRLLASSDGIVLAGGAARETQNLLADRHRGLLPGVALSAGIGTGRPRRRRGGRNAWHYGGDALLWITIGLTIYSGLGYFWRHRDLVRETDRVVWLEEALRNFDADRPVGDADRGGIAPELPHVVNFHLIAAQQANPFLIGKVVEAAGGIDRREQSHVFSVRNARGGADGAADIHKTRLRLHHDRDGRIGENLRGAIAAFDRAGQLPRS